MEPFADVNQRFHDAYDEARQVVVERKPVLVVLEDSMILRRGDTRCEVVVTPPLFHVIKAVAHAPLAIVSVLQRQAAGPLAPATRRTLERLHKSFMKSAAALTEDVVAPEGEPEGEPGGDEARDVAARLREILRASDAFVAPLVAGDAHEPARLHAFARALGPSLLAATHDATRLQLAAFVRELTPLLAQLDAHERQTFEVVVAGAHQARARSLAMQLFGKLLGEPPGAELRLVYAENVTDEKAALALVATRHFDRALAGAFFGDPQRLQRDILGDAVHEQLATLKLPSL